MAGKSLGTLTIDLIAKVGGFVAGMDRAERSSDEWSKTVQQNAIAAAKSIAAVASAAQGAAVAVGVAGYQLLKTTAAQISETDEWAKSLKMSTQELLAWQFAAEKAGLAGDNMNDIFKDLSDKIGDAVLNKSGDAVDALDSLRLSAEKLSKVSPDKQLLAIGEAISKISTTAGKVTILESLGNDLTKFIPLFENNNEKLKQFIELSKDYGVAPKPESIDDLVRVNDIFQQMEDQVKGLKIEIATGLAKADLSPLQVSLDKLHAVLTDPAIQQGLVDLVSNVSALAGWLIKTAAAAGDLLKFQSDRVAVLGGNINKGSEDQINAGIEELQRQLEDKKGFYNQGQSMAGWMLGEDDSAEALTGKLNDLIAAREKLRESKIPVLQLPTEPAIVGSAFGLGKGESNAKDKPDAAAKKLENAFKSAEQNYKKQIELIVTSGKKIDEVTELQKLQFDITSGKLSGLNGLQKTRLESLAKELDVQKQLKKTNEENLKVSKFIASLNSENMNAKQTLDIDIQGAWLGDIDRDRMRESLGIQADFLRQQRDLQTQFQSDDIDESTYDKKTQALNDAMKERLQIQEDYYKQVDELRNNGTAGFISGLATQIEASMDLYSNMQQVGAEAFSSLTDMLIQWAETGKLNVQDFAATFLQSVGSALLSYAAAQVAMAGLSAFSAMIGVPFVGPAIAPPAAIAATAAAGVLAIGVGSALKGQAHDGIDSVPETGTWLLQKGERVTTAQTSAKLDATLDRVSAQSTGGMNFSPVITVPINGNPSDSTVALVRSAVKEATLAAYNLGAQDLASGTGKMGKAMGNWATGRKVT
ncbi:phage tail tape measure protein [Serratia fonticola]|uniref:phage tail tape measure protein n=1 Tax=Serratia fonticola TaxID=47917 RepID=UPI0034C62248